MSFNIFLKLLRNHCTIIDSVHLIYPKNPVGSPSLIIRRLRGWPLIRASPPGKDREKRGLTNNSALNRVPNKPIAHPYALYSFILTLSNLTPIYRADSTPNHNHNYNYNHKHKTS